MGNTDELEIAGEGDFLAEAFRQSQPLQQHPPSSQRPLPSHATAEEITHNLLELSGNLGQMGDHPQSGNE